MSGWHTLGNVILGDVNSKSVEQRQKPADHRAGTITISLNLFQFEGIVDGEANAIAHQVLVLFTQADDGIGSEPLAVAAHHRNPCAGTSSVAVASGSLNSAAPR